MAIYKLQAGAELDVLSPREHDEHIQRSTTAIVKSVEGEYLTSTQQVTVDATGNLGGGPNGNGTLLYETPPGFLAILNRVTMDAQGYSPNAPMNSGYIKWHRGGPSSGSLVMFTPATGSAVLPFVWSEGRYAAPVFRSGEQLVLVGAGLPVNATIGIAFQFALFEVH